VTLDGLLSHRTSLHTSRFDGKPDSVDSVILRSTTYTRGNGSAKRRVYETHSKRSGLAAIKKDRATFIQVITILPLPSDKWRRNAPLLQLTNQKL
jgi:hypothetical protein